MARCSSTKTRRERMIDPSGSRTSLRRFNGLTKTVRHSGEGPLISLSNDEAFHHPLTRRRVRWKVRAYRERKTGSRNEETLSLSLIGGRYDELVLTSYNDREGLSKKPTPRVMPRIC